MMPTPFELATFANHLRAIAPPGTDVRVITFPSGAFDIEVRRGDGPIVIVEGNPLTPEYGVTADIRTAGGGFNDGHPFVCTNWTDAKAEIERAATVDHQSS